jgi:hypothetical protein
MFLVGLWATAVAAQADCPTIVQTALEATDDACDGTGRNQACYGNINLSAVAQEGVPEFNFDGPGDIVDVAGVQTLKLDRLDAASDIWGIALMRLQASLPDTLPGQNVTFLLFGDVEITNGVETNVEPVTFEVVSDGDINVRGGPSTNDERITGLAAGQSVIANGRAEDGSWLRVALEDGTPGWVSAELVTTEGDITLLNVIDPQALPPPVLNPMQAFYFKTGINDAPCDEAPDSGILIQTPEGAGQITLTVNEVDIQLGSTLYLQTLEVGEMAVNVVENRATVSAQGVTRFVPAGSRVRVPLGPNQAASGPPSEPEPYNNADLAALPVGHMPRAVVVANALTQAELDALTTAALPVSGDWQYTNGTVTLEGDCGEMSNLTQPPQDTQVITLNGAFVIGNMGELQPIVDGIDVENAEFTNPEPGLFVLELEGELEGHRFEVRVLSPTQVEGALLLIFPFNEQSPCTFTYPFTMVAANAPSADTQSASGEWFYEAPSASLSGGCDPTVPADPPPSRTITLNVSDTFSAEDLLRAQNPEFQFPDSAVYANPEPGVYTADWTDEAGSVFHLEMRFTSPTQAEGTTSLSWDDIRGRCTFETTFTLTAQ